MSAIPNPIGHSVNQLMDKLASSEGVGDGFGISMSDCAHECDRYIWYTLHWASTAQPMTGERASALRTGRTWEDRLIEEMISAGFVVRSRQEKVRLADGFVRGKLDGTVTGLIEAPKTEHVLEIKALKADKWRGVVKHGLAKHIADHYTQCQLYMHAKSLPRCAYLCVNKDTEERHIERLEYDPVFCIAQVARLERIAHSDEPPPRLHDDPTAKKAWQCGFCKHADVCAGAKPPRINCRTCLHNTFISPDQTTCGKYAFGPRGYEPQQSGCLSHRYIPSLVPGEQIDVRGDDVVYKMPDGTEYVDRDKTQDKFPPDQIDNSAVVVDDEIPF